MVSRSVDKAQENKDIQEYEQKGQIVYLNKDLSKVPHPMLSRGKLGTCQAATAQKHLLHTVAQDCLLMVE